MHQALARTPRTGHAERAARGVLHTVLVLYACAVAPGLAFFCGGFVRHTRGLFAVPHLAHFWAMQLAGCLLTELCSDGLRLMVLRPSSYDDGEHHHEE